MTPNLLHGMNGMKNKDIERLDLEYQYTMLARHVKDFLEEIVHYDTYNEGLYQIVDDDLEPMKKRLEVISNLLKRGEGEVCEVFAQAAGANRPADVSFVLNHWPSSQLCMDCEHGAFIMSEDTPASTYMCKVGEQLGSCASSCSKFEEQEFQEIE